MAEEKTAYGMKYVVDGALHTPTGRIAGLRTAWISETFLEACKRRLAQFDQNVEDWKR